MHGIDPEFSYSPSSGLSVRQEDGKSDTCVGFEMTEFPAIVAAGPSPRGAYYGPHEKRLPPTRLSAGFSIAANVKPRPSLS